MGRGGLAIALALGLLAGATSSRAACQLQKYAELPVTIERGGAVVAAKLNGTDARLTVDTGAFFSMLNPATVSRLGLKAGPLPPYLTVGGLTGEANVRLTSVKEVSVLGVPLHQVDFLVGEHEIGGTDGLLGQNLLSVLDTEFDFANGVIRLLEPQGCGEGALAYWAGDSHTYGAMSIDPIERPNLKIVGSVMINGVRMRAVFDTGAHRSVLSLEGARRAGVKTSDPGVVSGGAWGGIGHGVTRTWIAPFREVDIGGEQVKNTRLRIADLQLPDADMVLGADFFLSHRIYVAKSQRKLYFTFNGGPVFNLEVAPSPGAPSPGAPSTGSSPGIANATPAPGAPATGAAAPDPNQPVDAAGFARRGAAFEAREAYAQAIADFGRAAELEPNEPQHFVDRARTRLQNRQPFLALGDLDQALKLKSDDVAALMLRGQIRIAFGKPENAKADFDAALKVDPTMQLRIAEAYARADRFDDALANYDAWISSHPKNEDLANPLGGRCWVRALAGRDLDKALADCNEALRLWPGQPQLLGSRGLVFLRLKQADRAIADYNAALKLSPRLAWSLYGRGLAELTKGDKGKGDADMAAAVAITPRIAAEAKKNGVGA